MTTLPAATDSRSRFATWLTERLDSFKTITLSALSYPLVFATAWFLWPTPPSLPTRADRVFYALQLLAAPAVVALLMCVACFRIFDTNDAQNPLANGESERFRISQRVLTNTIEQAWIFVPLLVALSARIAPEHAKLLPIATTLWCAGRVLFALGYHVRPSWRGPGFGWTIHTSLVLAAWYAYTLV